MTDAPTDLSPRLRPEALDFLLNRRSTPAKTLADPAPGDAALRTILTAAARTPDHGKLEPWRFLLIRGDAQAALGRAAAARAVEIGLEDEAAAKAEKAFNDGPLIVAVIAAPKASAKIPEIEQKMSAAAVCLALVNAALASGWGANWLSGWASHDAPFCQTALGLAPHESVAGFIHIGTPRLAPPERPRPDVATITMELSPDLGVTKPAAL
ncbi:MAG: nitroreductase [Rhodobacteraceae bacterium]|nr:nitroreductase [Paracoccaceae bacterium]